MSIRRKVAPWLAAALVIGWLSAAPPVAAAPAAVPTITAATLLTGTPDVLGSSSPTSSLYLSQQTGWTFSYNNDDNFSAEVTNGDDEYEFNFQESYQAMLRGARKVAVDIDLNGGSCADQKNGEVKDIAVNPSGQITRLDVVFAAPCGATAENGYVAGEFQYNEPILTPVRSQPSELFFPPTNARSATQTYPIELFGTSATPQAIHSLRIGGADPAAFDLSDDSCSGTTVTETSACTVDVTYHPGSGPALADVVAFADDGTTLSETALDAVPLPGINYWTDTAPVESGNELRQTYTGPNSDVIEGASISDTNSIVALRLALPDNFSAQTLELVYDGVLRPGLYRVGGSHDKMFALYSSNGESPLVTSGLVRVFHASNTRTERGLVRVPDIALTFELATDASPLPIYGAIGSQTQTPMRLPGLTRPTRLRHLHRHRVHRSVRVSWEPSTDIAVVSYQLRVRPGKHAGVGFHRGMLAYSGAQTTTALRRRINPFTVTVYALDADGHHSPGRTSVIR